MTFPIVTVSEEPIDIAALLQQVRGDEDGGIASFIGTVRNHDGGQGVQRLEYSSYVDMAESVIRNICKVAAEKYEVTHIAAVHRIGIMDIGSTVVAVVAASPHRAQCLDAVRYIIDDIKANAPIWKKEHYTEGQPAWKEIDNADWDDT